MAEVERAVLSLCANCSRYGKKVSSEMQPASRSQDYLEEKFKDNYNQIISDAMDGKGISVEELAVKIKCSPRELKKIAKGEILPSNEIALKLQKALRILLYDTDHGSDSGFKGHSDRLSFGDVVEIKKKKDQL